MKKKYVKLSIVLLLCVICLTTIFQLNRKDKVYDYAFDAIDMMATSDIEEGFTSAQIAIIQDGELIYSNCWGLTNSYDENGERISDAKPVDKNTMYDLASNTKMYSVIYSIQYLVSKGLLDVDTPIKDILGDEYVNDTLDLAYLNQDYPGQDVMKEWKSKVTLKNVLAHRAGYPASYAYYNQKYNPFIVEEEMPNPLYQGDEGLREDVYKQVLRTPLLHEPGKEVLYSDIDYVLGCFVVEKITGMRIDEFIKETFFKPLNLNRISYTPLESGYNTLDCAATELHGNTRDGVVDFDGIRTYTLQGEVHDELAYYTMKGISGHAGLFSNAEDLAKLAYLMIDGTYDNQRFFNEDVIEEFITPIDEDNQNYGIGWWRQDDKGSREWYFSTYAKPGVIGHQGWTGTLTMIDRENKLVAVTLTNKINSPLTDKELNSNKFDGNWYETGYLGYTSSMIYGALQGKTNYKTHKLISDNLDFFVADALNEMKDIENHPSQKAYNAMLKARDMWHEKYN